MIDKTQAIALMLATKDDDMRPTFQYILFTYDAFGRANSPTVKEVAKLLNKPETSISTYVSKLCKLGLMERIGKGEFRTTSKWVTKKANIMKCNKRLTKLLTKW